MNETKMRVQDGYSHMFHLLLALYGVSLVFLFKFLALDFAFNFEGRSMQL